MRFLDKISLKMDAQEEPEGWEDIAEQLHDHALGLTNQLEQLEQHSAILLQLIDRGFTDAPGIETATEEMIADGVVPDGWTIYDVKAVAPKEAS
jgi:hypothetical protein